MPLQNRVDPFGQIHAVSERGALTGNRGIIHDATTKTLTRRRWTSRAWIACTCVFKGRHRAVMSPGTWTELFFLDEATALAAGHRPCFECRRADALAFQAAWAKGHGTPLPRAGEMDKVLHAQRCASGAGPHALPAGLNRLPTGTMVAVGDEAYLVCEGTVRPWSFAGYGAPPAAPLTSAVLVTPPAVVAALEAGYRPGLHQTAVM